MLFVVGRGKNQGNNQKANHEGEEITYKSQNSKDQNINQQ